MGDLKLTLHHYRVLHQIRLGNVTCDLYGFDLPARVGVDSLDHLHDLGLWRWHDQRARLTPLGAQELDQAIIPARYLTFTARPGGSVLGYTHNPHSALDRRPVLSDADELAPAAHYRDKQRREAQNAERRKLRELLALEDRIRTVKAQAHMAGINISAEMRAIEQLKRYAGAPKILSRLRVAERKVDERRLAA